MSELATLYKNIDYLSKSDIRLVINYVNQILNKNNRNPIENKKNINLSKYQEVGIKFTKNANDYVKDLRNGLFDAKWSMIYKYNRKNLIKFNFLQNSYGGGHLVATLM